MQRLPFIACLTAAALFATDALAERSTDGDEELLPIYETRAEKLIAKTLPPIITVDDPPPLAPHSPGPSLPPHAHPPGERGD